MIVSFESNILERLWVTGNVTLLPSAYVYEVIEVLDLLDASEQITDLELLGGFKISRVKPDFWAVTITVNNIEPVGSITCIFSNNNAYDVNLNQYD